jgi:hypothetical protein
VVKINQDNVSRKQAGVAILISDTVDFNPKVARRDKEGYFILIKEQYIKRK